MRKQKSVNNRTKGGGSLPEVFQHLQKKADVLLMAGAFLGFELLLSILAGLLICMGGVV